MKGKQFFCEHCGHPVSLTADRCPNCSRVFDAVKCPVCSFSGKPVLFSDGCPSCGYLSAKKPVSGVDPRKAPANSEIPFGEAQKDVEESQKRPSLPRWVYTVILVGLIGFLVFLAAMYLRT